MDFSKVNLMSMWTVIIATLSASLWMFTNIAWASDIDRMEARLIKGDLRELRAALKVEVSESARERLEQDIQEAIDELCDVKPDDRECSNG